jgi:hypothetical protein
VHHREREREKKKKTKTARATHHSTMKMEEKRQISTKMYEWLKKWE